MVEYIPTNMDMDLEQTLEDSAAQKPGVLVHGGHKESNKTY